MLENKDVVLLVTQAGRHVMSPVQLQKAVFLVSKGGLKGLPEEMYDFQPHHYGPFDSKIYDDAEELYDENLVLRTRSRYGAWTDTIITPAGMEKAAELSHQLPSETIDRLTEIVDEVQSLSFHDLLRRVYREYPEFRKNSVFQY